ncbi:MAG: extracellular solute-binding protein, partial [Sphaerochaetaceae bacterium]
AGLVDSNGNALVPKTWEEFHDFAKKMTIKDANGKVIQQGAVIQWNDDMHGTVLGALQAARGNIYGSDDISINFDNPEFRNILKVWKEGVADGSFSTETFADTDAGRNDYKAGKVAMLIESSGRWVEGGNALGFDKVSVCGIPGDGGSCGYVNGVFLPKASKNTAIALQFIKEGMLGEYSQVNTLNQYGKIPVITAYFDKADRPEWANIKHAMDYATTYPAYNDSGKFQDQLRIIIQEGLVNGTVADTVAKLEAMIASLNK